ncbi:MAG: CopD family protein [Thermaceae bacterium]|nr:CopD family protein [Thermaceae bacterium]
MHHQGHDLTQSYIQAALYLGVFALLGAGFFARYIGPEVARAQAWRLWYLLSLGFLLALGATVYGSYHAVWMLGDPSLLLEYWTETSQGNLLAARAVLMLALLGLSLGWARFDRWLWPPLALALLLSLALNSHAGAKGPAIYLTDLVHLAFGAAWAGSVLALALTWPRTRFEAVRVALERLSRLGLISVVGVGLAGVVLAVAQLGGWDNLFGSRYGRTLLLKLGAVAAVLAVAAVNRRWLMPRVRQKAVRGLGTVSLEALLLVLVLALSGLLASTEPPTPAPHRLSLEGNTGAQHYSGQLYAEAGQVQLQLELRDLRGQPLNPGPAIPLRLVKDGEAVEQTLQPLQRAQYRTTIQVPPGTYEVTLALPEETLEYTLVVPAR